MPESVEQQKCGDKWSWVEVPPYRINAGDPCPGASDFDNPLHDLVFREFETLRAFPAYAASFGSKPERLVEALTVVEWERHTVTDWLQMQDEKGKRRG